MKQLSEIKTMVKAIIRTDHEELKLFIEVLQAIVNKKQHTNAQAMEDARVIVRPLTNEQKKWLLKLLKRELEKEQKNGNIKK